MSAARDGAAFDGAFAAIAEFYCRNERALRRWLAWKVNAPPALVEDACSSAWLILLAKRPDCCSERLVGWLRTTALHEAYRLLRWDQREQPRELYDTARPVLALVRREDPEIALAAKRALLAVASLPERARRYTAWHVGGHRYREIQELAGGATYTNVDKHMRRGHARLRALAEQASERPVPPQENKGGVLTTGSCRRCHLRPRRVRRGTVEPLCDDCYRDAMEKVARELAEEKPTDRLARYRGMSAAPRERVENVADAGARTSGRAVRSQPPAQAVRAAAGGPARRISEELLHEAKRLYASGLSMRAVAETLLEHTGYANAHSAEVSLRSQFERRGWPLRTRRQAQRMRRGTGGDDLARAA